MLFAGSALGLITAAPPGADRAHCHSQGDFNMSTFLQDASMWLVISAAGSILVGVAFLHLFRHYAGVMTRLTIASQASDSPPHPEIKRRRLCPVIRCPGLAHGTRISTIVAFMLTVREFGPTPGEDSLNKMLKCGRTQC